MPTLFEPLQLGALTLPNRVIMAPLTRLRSKQPGNIPWELNATYYTQRASAGLIISEATQICQQGQGYPGSPGIHSAEQVDGWKKVTQAVQAAGGRIFLQLWHVGRISHSSFQPGNDLPVAPSAIAASGLGMTADWKQEPFQTPRALATSEINTLVETYGAAARNAKSAGFDGVEIHGANGYLLDQFLQDGSNKRTDQYGGSIENRSRFLFEVLEAVIGVWGKERVGVRLSPYGSFNDMSDSDPVALFSHVLSHLVASQIAYAHLVEPRSSGAGGSEASITSAPATAKLFRSYCQGSLGLSLPLISAGGYNRAEAMHAVESGVADAIAFGRLFISNPDLPLRLQRNADLNAYNRQTFYGGAEKGYTDYPIL